MKHWQVGAVLTLALASAATASYAQVAYTAKDVNVRAGPARDYPVVTRLPRGVALSVQGCLSGYHWCDIAVGRNRGWVYGGNIVYPYQGDNVPLLTYGSMIGVGIVAFSAARYWDTYYVGRPWYSQRHVWVSRPPPHYGSGGHRPPPAYRPGGSYPPPRPDYRPGGPAHRPPPPGLGAGGPSRPPHGQGPGNGHQPPQGQGPGNGHRPPQGQAPGNGHRPPQGPGSGNGQRPPQT